MQFLKKASEFAIGALLVPGLRLFWVVMQIIGFATLTKVPMWAAGVIVALYISSKVLANELGKQAERTNALNQLFAFEQLINDARKPTVTYGDGWSSGTPTGNKPA